MKIVHSDYVLYKVTMVRPGKSLASWYVFIDSVEFSEIAKSIEEYFNQGLDEDDDKCFISALEQMSFDILMTDD